MKYTPSHEWIKIENGKATIGISRFAKEELGDIVYIQLPPVGKNLALGEEVAILESTKAAADVYSPVSGEVIAVNEALLQDLSLLNRSPEGEGWLFQMKLSKEEELKHLLDQDAYLAMIEG